MTDQRILASSAVMAAGTVFSRLSGFVRSALLVAALGAVLRGDLFSIANTLPNMVYILVAGGVFNAVLVPQLVRRIKDDPDGGDAYASRVVTLSALFLGVVTVVLVVVTPSLLRLYLDPTYLEPHLAPQLETLIDLTRWCLPQVFFYGMFVLLGQILNAHERFGPMMWAPIVNNVIAVAMLVTYLLVFGPVGDGPERYDALSRSQEVLLGLGSTLGIAAQLAVLLPYLRAAGFSYRPRFDFRDPELRHTLSLGTWTVLFVVVTQLAYLQVVRLASGGTASGGEGTGYTIYSGSLLIMMVPHAVVTVSLATAILPTISRQAHEGRLPELGRTVGSTLRTALALVLPFAVLLPVVAGDLTTFMFGWVDDEAARLFTPTLALFGPALVFFTVHYFMLRGFYAMEQTRRVFFIQCAVSLTNVVVATALVNRRPPEDTAPMLVVGYLASYVVGAATSYAVLRHTVGGLQTPALVRFLVRMAVVLAAAVGTALLVERALAGLGEDPSPVVALARAALVGASGGVVVLVGARLLHVGEVTSLVDTVVGRLRRG
jgi:putative peptidoglycan lipid II flippase